MRQVAKPGDPVTIKDGYNDPGSHIAGSTDFGDVSQIMPVLQFGTSGYSGSGHTPSYAIEDPDIFFIATAKIFALIAYKLLKGDAAAAQKLIADYQAPMTRDDFLQYLQDLQSEYSQEMVPVPDFGLPKKVSPGIGDDLHAADSVRKLSFIPHDHPLSGWSALWIPQFSSWRITVLFPYSVMPLWCSTHFCTPAFDHKTTKPVRSPRWTLLIKTAGPQNPAELQHRHPQFLPILFPLRQAAWGLNLKPASSLRKKRRANRPAVPSSVE